MKKKSKDTFTFLRIGKLIKEKHLSPKDVATIKDNLASSFKLVYLLCASVFSLLIFALVTYQFISSNGNYIGTYGLAALVGSTTLIAGSVISIILLVSSKFAKTKKKTSIAIRFASVFLYFSVCSYMLCCIFSDAKMGFTVNSETLSASIIFIAILVIIQPMYWVDAVILDLGTTVGIISVAIYCNGKFGMGAVIYYVLVALVFPFACYMIIALLFYAESQKYKEVIENERLHNHAYYDSLTHCKNRHYLNEFLENNKLRWDGKDNVNLLIVLFDIDDFRLYNNQFSHLGGDYCLKSLCDAVRREFPSPDLDFFRYGGEEFLLFFELKDAKDAPTYLERVRKSVSGLEITAPKGAPKEHVTISIGGLLLKNINNFIFEKEMEKVDEYLYKAKAAGKDVVCYNGSIIQ